MKIEIPLDEDVINDAVEKAIGEIDDILDGVDVEELVRDRISDISNSDMLEDVDVESLVRDEIDGRDIMDDIDVEALVNDKIEDTDLLEGIDIEKIIVDHISRLIGKDDFEEYVISSNRIKVLEDELQAVRVELSRMNSTIINRSLCQVRKWYQIW